MHHDYAVMTIISPELLREHVELRIHCWFGGIVTPHEARKGAQDKDQLMRMQHILEPF